jgi:hypothetical protein
MRSAQVRYLRQYVSSYYRCVVPILASLSMPNERTQGLTS